MKFLLNLCLLLSLSISSLFSQSNNVILFTENGEKFQVILNGILQNPNPETNIKLTELPAPTYKCRILFADSKLGKLDFNIYFQEAGEELTMSVRQNKKGEYVTRYVSSIPITLAPPAPVNQVHFIYSENTPPSTVTTTISQTSTTHSNDSKPGEENINIQMGVNVNDEGGSINIQSGAMDMQNESVSSTVTTTTTTHTVTTSTSTQPEPITPIVYVIGYNGPIGCPHPMNPADFGAMKQSISSKDFESTRLSIAKQVLLENCLLAEQVQEVISLFDFENTKLEYAKFAYDHTYDTGNYFMVNDMFEFESSVEDLNKYISGKQRAN